VAQRRVTGPYPKRVAGDGSLRSDGQDTLFARTSEQSRPRVDAQLTVKIPTMKFYRIFGYGELRSRFLIGHTIR
jgi:hypothetical protein